MMDFDPGVIQRIITNLLSNALKFTPEYGQIKVVAKEVVQNNKLHLEIKVSNTGKGIEEKNLEKIFKDFYQEEDSIFDYKQGIGLGLSIVKQLIKLVGGNIIVENNMEKQETIFTFWIPINQNEKKQKAARTEVELMPIITSSIELNKNQIAPTGAPTILLIEDNRDVLNYLQSCLKFDYQLLFAQNGQVGIELAFNKVPDIIISDVKMPEKDGLEVCNTLKNDIKTSHIPIIMLTAIADIESKIAGLKTGADVYLSKPFEKEELLVQVQNLIHSRSQLQMRLANLDSKDLPDANVPPLSELDEVFLEEIENLIKEELINGVVTVAWLSNKFGMSERQLYQKIRALRDMPPINLIKEIKKREAMRLVNETDLPYKEIAYELGFKSPSNFNNSFKKWFGGSPTSFRK